MPSTKKVRGRKPSAIKSASLQIEAFERPGEKIAEAVTRDRLLTAIVWLMDKYPHQAMRWALGRVQMWTHLPPRLEAELLNAYDKRATREKLTARCQRELERFYRGEESRQDMLLIDSLVKGAALDGYPIASKGEKTAFDKVAETMLRSPSAVRKRFYEPR